MLAILDYDAGNIESVRLALRHVGGDPVFVRDAAEAAKADRIVFPGVGSAAQCMTNLKARGFDSLLREAVARGTPVLAICIGMQLLFDSSAEDGGVAALGILPGTVKRFIPDAPKTKVPHMGWNTVAMPTPHPLLPDAREPDAFYFVHSYYAQPADPGVVYGTADYCGLAFTAMAGTGSLFAAQFHPEKSGPAGLDILRRFLQWDGRPC
ncbi:MAG: imidazole glycerol phosphate synthase subunit HisH [Planctomycetaceae bacterium]|nr:imidazole glycerol phosphate synthase subunit HisH [Planctomycetaceae bacterium]